MGLVSGWHRRQTSRGTRIGAGCGILEGGGEALTWPTVRGWMECLGVVRSPRQGVEA